jgi:NitT/TauT family transport system substrate-binding protein
MRTRRVRGIALLATVMALALTAGCSSRGAAANAPAVEKPNLNVAVVPALDSAGFFVALYQGLFKAQGLNVHFVPATSSETVIAGQAKGTYDITGGNYVSYIQAQQRGEADLKIFAEGSVMEPGAQGMETVGVLALDSYPVSDGPAGTVDKVRLQRVVNVMQQFLGFPAFNIDSMLLNGG